MTSANARAWTADQDAALCAAHQNHRTGAIARLGREWGIPFSTLHNRARWLGLPVTRHRGCPRRWTAAEDQIVIDGGYLPGRALQARLAAAGFSRSVLAVEGRRRDLRQRGVPVGLDRPGLTVAEAAVGLGCSEITVCRWIRRGWLKATVLSPDSPAKRYQIHDTDLRRFCLRYTGALAHCRPDLVWYTDLVGRPIG